MGRRSDIDWEKVERLYVAGQLTITQIAVDCGIHLSSLKAKAKERGWKRDLSAAIEARTKAKISTLDVNELIEKSASESAEKSAKTIKDAIEQASDVAAGIVLKHRASIRLEHERGLQIEALLDNAMASAEEIRDINTVAQTYKLLVDSKSKLRDQERVVFGLDKEHSAEGSAADEVRKAIADYKRGRIE